MKIKLRGFEEYLTGEWFVQVQSEGQISGRLFGFFKHLLLRHSSVFRCNNSPLPALQYSHGHGPLNPIAHSHGVMHSHDPLNH